MLDVDFLIIGKSRSVGHLPTALSVISSLYLICVSTSVFYIENAALTARDAYPVILHFALLLYIHHDSILVRRWREAADPDLHSPMTCSEGVAKARYTGGFTERKHFNVFF